MVVLFRAAMKPKHLEFLWETPEFKARDLIRQHNIKVFSSNYALYGDLSQRVMKILENFCPSVEVYSIDEAFLNCEGDAAS